jgi:hypothetical protein
MHRDASEYKPEKNPLVPVSTNNSSSGDQVYKPSHKALLPTIRLLTDTKPVTSPKNLTIKHILKYTPHPSLTPLNNSHPALTTEAPTPKNPRLPSIPSYQPLPSSPHSISTQKPVFAPRNLQLRISVSLYLETEIFSRIGPFEDRKQFREVPCLFVDIFQVKFV